MQVIKAKTAGFCFGVKRAVDTVYEQVRQNSGEKYTPTVRLSITRKSYGIWEKKA